MCIEDIIVKCPTYKNSFTLRRALIDLGVRWVTDIKLEDGIFWKEMWNEYKDNAAYIFMKNKIVISDINNIIFFPPYMQNFKIYSLNEFLKEYYLKK